MATAATVVATADIFFTSHLHNARLTSGVVIFGCRKISPSHLRVDDARYNVRVPIIVLNGESREISADISISELLRSAGFAERRVAVEVNREIVPKSRHAEQVLHEGDRVEIVHALGGG